MPKEKPHPFQIVVGENAEMKCWECHLMIGKFPDKDEAQEMADILAELMEAGGANVLKQQ